MPALLVVGRVLTQVPDRPAVGAVGVVAGRVVALGDPGEVRRQLPGRPVELTGRHVVPGFVDSHAHVLWSGRATGRARLGGADSVGQVLDRLSRHAAEHPGSGWVQAEGDLELPGGRLPSLAELDRVLPGRPLFVDRKGHDALVNSAALAAAGIGPGTPDPPGGRIERDATGRPTGVLVEQPAVALVRAVLPEPDDATRARWIEAGSVELRRHGITTVVDPAVGPADLPAYAALARAGRLPLRTVVLPLGGADTDDATLDAAVVACGLPTAAPDRLRRGPTKLFLDGGGSLGTALRSTPWPGTDGYRGNQTLSRDVLLGYVRAAVAAGRGVAVHTVGDAAVDLALEVFAEVDAGTPVAGTGSHLVHAYLGPGSTAMVLARRLGVAVSAHPALQWACGAELVRRLGETEAAAANPLRSWLDAGVLVGGGSDSPGPPSSVLLGMWQARTRHVRGRTAPLGPAQKVTAAEALTLFTTAAAAVAGVPGAGTLRVGGPADVAVLDVDPLGPAHDLAEGRVTATVMAGEVHEHP